MSAPTNHWKLGLFVIVGFCAAVGTIFFFGARSLKTENVRYKSYFDESVQGLEVGSPVKFRGVTIGTVANIDVASDHRHVEVSCDLAVKDLNALGLSVEKAQGLNTKMNVPSELRVQLVSAGITGVKFIQIDFFNPKEYPPLQLPFEVPENYIPTAASVMKNLEDSVVHAVDRFPALADQLLVVLARIGDILGEIEQKKLPDKVLITLQHLDGVLDEIRSAIKSIEPGKLSLGAKEVLSNLNGVLGRMSGDRGLVASAQRMSDSMGSTALNANHVGPALEDTLRDVQNAAQSIQRLADALERDPDMLLKGRAKRSTK